MSANIDKYQILTISLSRQGCCKDAAVKPVVIKKRSLTRNRIFPNFFSVQSVYFDKVGITLFPLFIDFAAGIKVWCTIFNFNDGCCIGIIVIVIMPNRLQRIQVKTNYISVILRKITIICINGE